MKTEKKNLILISGATGSIGSSFFEQFILDDDFHVVGLSRSGLQISSIPEHHSIVHFNFEDKKSYEKIGNLIRANTYKKIIYVHAVGRFLTEIIYDKNNNTFSEPQLGTYDEETVKLTFHYTSKMIDFLLKNTTEATAVVVVNIASLSDEFEIPVFQSWRYAQTKLINFFSKRCKQNKNLSVLTLRVSTILSAKEIVDRPYLFGTNTDPSFWLTKTELVDFVKKEIKRSFCGSKIKNLFKVYPKFDKDHWNGKKTFMRRLQELHGHK